MSVFKSVEEIELAIAAVEPEPLRNMILAKLTDAFGLVRENNKRVSQVNEAKDNDPNNVEYLDKVWARVAADNEDAEIVAAEKRYQAAIKESEKQLKLMREIAKAKHCRPTLSEKEVQDLKKSINDGKQTITESMIAAKSFAEMADQMLTLAGKPIEDGILSRMPHPDSLLNARGRKSTATAAASDKPNFTRVSEILVGGIATSRKNSQGISKAHFSFAAEELSKLFGASRFESNKVTPLQLEEAYYASKEIDFRNAGAMPVTHEFTFEKEIEVQNPNDDSTKMEPQKILIQVTRNVRADKVDKSETEKAEKPEETKSEETKPSTEKK